MMCVYEGVFANSGTGMSPPVHDMRKLTLVFMPNFPERMNPILCSGCTALEVIPSVFLESWQAIKFLFIKSSWSCLLDGDTE